MTDSYPIIQVESDWVEETEDMGSKGKFWFSRQEGEPRWLFKRPRPQSGEHWSEKIAEQVANLLDIPHGKVELAEFNGERGSATRSFVSKDEILIHGNQILAETMLSYDSEMEFNQSDHTLDNIFRSLDAVFALPGDAEAAKRQFAEYATLDALIGNTDRHHENWGIVRKIESDESFRWLAPSYDHASSLGRELRDSARDRHLRDGVERYVERGRGGIYWNPDDRRGPSPLRLARLATERYPDMFVPAMRKLGDLSESDLVRSVNRIPDGWMSESAACFAISTMRYNLAKLREVVVR